MNTSYDRFIRTTNVAHKDRVSKIFKKLYDQGDIYKGKYEGWYCKACESFFTDTQLVDGKCPDCGGDVSLQSEEAYFFKLEKYAKQLEEYINLHPEFIQPENRRNEIINNFIKPGLQDLCVSRTSFSWGVPVEFDKGHVVYVWIDALSNYITFLGYNPEGESEDDFNHFWPADLHLIGKDILRFHAIYWPVMLMALGLELPKQIFGHPWVLMGTNKMSKSKGNIIYADDLVKYFGVDEVRYYLLHEIPFANDGSITYELLIERINSDLANILGNLVNRTISMSKKYFEGVVVEPGTFEAIDREVIELVLNAKNKVDENMNNLRVADAIDNIFEIFRRANKYIDETTPWVLAKDDAQKERLATVIYVLLESIRQGAVLLQPFLPESSETILHQLNTNNRYLDSLNEFNGMDYGIILNDPEPIFARIDRELKLEEIQKEENYEVNPK